MSKWAEKVIVVTGGTAGLGLAIANEFISLGATVVSLSRSANEGPERNVDSFHHIRADVRDKESVRSAVANIANQFGQIDVWVNNVGKSTRASLESATVDDYRELMELNFLSAVRCTEAALPHLQKSSGAIVNIGSLAAKTGWKSIGPYVTSKHALAGFAHQLRIEGPENVHSLFVCPGPIAREDAGTRYSDSVDSLEQSAAAPGAGVKLSGIAPQKVARRIIAALEQKKSEIVIPSKARLLFSALQFSPRLGDWILKKFSS